MLAKVNMYVFLIFCENSTTNIGDMEKSISLIILLVLPILQFESQYLVRGTGLKFFTQVGLNDPICSDLSKCL